MHGVCEFLDTSGSFFSIQGQMVEILSPSQFGCTTSSSQVNSLVPQHLIKLWSKNVVQSSPVQSSPGFTEGLHSSYTINGTMVLGAVSTLYPSLGICASSVTFDLFCVRTGRQGQLVT